MEKEERSRRLNSLSPRQREVFKLFCGGSDYANIAKELVITEGAVRAHMANIYTKLGLLELSQQERWKEIFQNYCPLLETGVFGINESTADEEAEDIEPIPEEVEKIIREDEFALVPVEPILINTTRADQQNARRRGGLRPGITVLVTVILTIFVLNWLGILDMGRLFAGPGATSTEGMETDEVVLAEADTPTVTPSPLSPTQETPTPTLEPSSTPRPTPTLLPLPFSDRFDAGPRPEWDFTGNWLVTDGQLTMQYEDFEYLTASLDLTGWTDYRVTVDLYIPYWGSANTARNAIFVRRSNDETMMLGFFQGFRRDGGWAIYPTNATDPEYIAGTGGEVPQSSTIRLDVIGNTFTGYVNGIKIQEIFFTGYDRGTLVLMSLCQDVTACPLWDNLVVEPFD